VTVATTEASPEAAGTPAPGADPQAVPPATEGEAPAADAADATPVPATTAEPEPEPEGEGDEAKKELAPIIIKKIIADDHAGAHGGAWKIALADMMTAMMAFFLLMWLLGATNSDQRKSIADYFKPTTVTKSVISVNNTSGSQGLMGGQSIIDPEALPQAATQTGLMQILTPREVNSLDESDKTKIENPDEEQKKKFSREADQANFEKLQKELKEKLDQDPSLARLREQVNFVREKEGLRIEVIDKADFSMFGLGNSDMSGRAQTLIQEIAKSVSSMPNKVKVRGHTDSIPYDGATRNNWSLSAERADVTRQMLAARGVDSKRIARIEGVADTEPFNSQDARDPRNRRISITLMYQDP
jgi:chemotaxis protein MotB